MSDTSSIGKLLIFAGLLLAFLGIVVFFGGKYLPLGKLPGDIRIQKENFSFYFPITTCIVLSILFSFIFWIISKFNK